MIHRSRLKPCSANTLLSLVVALTVNAWSLGAEKEKNSKAGAVENSVVKVFTTVRYPDPYKPWTKAEPREYSGSGVVIDGHRILTAAHLVAYGSQVEIQANQAGDKLLARVVAMAPAIDLAVITLEDTSFFKAHPALPRATELPGIKDVVMSYGYATGGNSLSITKGIVSRIEFTTYSYPVMGLRIQIDAALNPGNSGGAAVVGDKLIGIAFGHLGAGDNIGYIIPCEEIELFLNDIADGHYDGKPAIYESCQTLENPVLREFLKLDSSVQGLIVRKPDSDEPSYPLKTWDVITRIGTTPVDDQGMIKAGPNLRLSMRYLVQKIAKNGTVPLTIVRNGKEMRVELPVASNRPMVIRPLRGAYPSYFVFGPMVFSTATTEFTAGLNRGSGSNRAALNAMLAGSPLVTRILDKPAFEGEELVVVASPFFPHRLCRGYDNPLGRVLECVNKKPVKNLAQLVEILRDAKEEFITFEFYHSAGETLVFRRSEMVNASEGILTDNGVRNQGSPDMLAIWNSKMTASTR